MYKTYSATQTELAKNAEETKKFLATEQTKQKQADADTEETKLAEEKERTNRDASNQQF